MMAVGGALEAALLPGLEAVLAHQPSRSASPYLQARVLQLAGHGWTAVGLMGEGGADVGQQDQVLPLAAAGRTASPGKVAALADTTNLAQALDGEVLFRRIDEP